MHFEELWKFERLLFYAREQHWKRSSDLMDLRNPVAMHGLRLPDQAGAGAA